VVILLILVAPLSTGEQSAVVVEVFFNLVLVAGAYSAASQRGHRWPFLAFTTLTLLARWNSLLWASPVFVLGSSVLTVVWIAYVIAIVAKQLFAERAVTTNTIFAAVVVYLLAAVAFAYFFEILEVRQPGSFAGLPRGGHPRELGNALMYFSLVCLTTTGFGDIVPVSALTRPLAALEGVFGSLYLAVMIARLVGLHMHAGKVER